MRELIIAVTEQRDHGVDQDVARRLGPHRSARRIYNPLRLLEGQPFVFKQYETAHPYSTWSAELNGNPCQEIFNSASREER